MNPYLSDLTDAVVRAKLHEIAATAKRALEQKGLLSTPQLRSLEAWLAGTDNNTSPAPPLDQTANATSCARLPAKPLRKPEERPMPDSRPPCHAKPKEEWCDRDGPGGFMGHTCQLLPKRRIMTDQQTGERVWAIVYVAVLLERQQNGTMDKGTTFYQEAEEEADRAREAWFKRLSGVNGGQST